MAESLSDVAIKQLSVAERLDLISVLWDSIPEDQMPIPEWHSEELERRLAAADADPDGEIPWGEIRQRLAKEAMSPISKTQIDRLGDRLKKGEITDEDLRLLDEYRRSFSEAYEFVVRAIKDELALEPTGRPAKSTTSISEKLVRESIRLTQIQDIAGCRLIVSEMADQERVVDSLNTLFDNTTIVDRRERPSHGYRAVHVIVRQRHKLVEVQVRTSLQQAWAELSEKLSDVVNPAIKYGRGDEGIVKELLEYSALVAEAETLEAELVEMETSVSGMLSQGTGDQNREQELVNLKQEIIEAQKRQVSIREFGLKMLQNAIARVPKGGGTDVVSD